MYLKKEEISKKKTKQLVIDIKEIVQKIHNILTTGK